jgi:hypothetical protein
MEAGAIEDQPLLVLARVFRLPDVVAELVCFPVNLT